MSREQKVKVELRNGRFRLADSAKMEDLNPKALMLCAAAQCAGYTVMSILRVDNIVPKMFEIIVTGLLDTPNLQPSSRYEKFSVEYKIECRNIGDQNAVSEAVQQAQQHICGVIAMLRNIAPVEHEISIVSTESVSA